MEKRNKIVYWILTGLVCLLMLFSASMYFLNHDEVVVMFGIFGYPAYIIYPLAIAKILGVLAILTRKSKTLTEWAYAGFFFDLVLALFAHYMIGDAFILQLVFIFVLLGSYILGKRIFK